MTGLKIDIIKIKKESTLTIESKGIILKNIGNLRKYKILSLRKKSK